jgi:hypothetical protein
MQRARRDAMLGRMSCAMPRFGAVIGVALAISCQDATRGQAPPPDGSSANGGGGSAGAGGTEAGGTAGTGGATCGGKDCLGGNCVLDACQPLRVWKSPSLEAPGPLAVDSDHIYSVHALQLLRVKKMFDATAVTITTGVHTRPVIDDVFAYFVASGVHRIPKGGGPVEQLVPNDSLGSGVAVDAQRLYYVNSADLYSIAKQPGGSPTLLLETPPNAYGPDQLTANDEYLVWRRPGEGISKRQTSSGQTTLVGGSASTALLTIGAGHIVWLDFDSAISAAPIDGGPVVTIVTASDGPPLLLQSNAIAADETHVYWTSLTKSIHRAPLSGGSVEELASGYDFYGQQAIVSDDKAIYFADGQAIYMLAK